MTGPGSNPPRWKPNPDPTSIVIPGLDVEASTIDQIEQIEQLITIKLQNIDENFSKIHNILANKLLPAVKRYAVGTEPVRDAAKFWTSFYEQAAQIRISTYDDYSTVNDVPSEREDQTVTAEPSEDHPQFEATVNSETSFLPGQGAFSSTPATTARIVSSQPSFTSQVEDPSWTQSPLAKLSDELKAFSSLQDLHSFNTAGHDSIDDQSSSSSSIPQEQSTFSTIPASAKGKGKDTAHPLLKNVLRHNLYSANDSSTFDNTLKPTSPLKFRGKNQTPIVDRSRNPYIPPGSSSTDWSGVVNLRDTSMLTPDRHRGRKSPAKATPQNNEIDDDSFDELPSGMSPLVLMSPVRPPRSSAELGLLKLKQTPTREASKRIQRDLIMSALKSVHKSGVKGQPLRKQQTVVDSSMSTVPSPPSLSRYTRRDEVSSSISKNTSLDSMIRHIKEDIGSSGGKFSVNVDSTPGVGSYLEGMQKVGLQPHPPRMPFYESHHNIDDSLDSDQDSLDSVNNTVHPSAAFLMASGGAPGYINEDSFSSNHSSDSLENEDPVVLEGGIVPIHPFAVGGTVEDDGFDDDDDSDDGFEIGPPGIVGVVDEDTVFGLASGQRESAAFGGQHLRMLGEDLLEDTIGIGAQLAATGRVEESPTPAGWGR